MAYLKWLQQKTPQVREWYQLAKKEAKTVVKNEEWAELGMSLQDNFQNNQKQFAAESRGKVKAVQIWERYVMGVAR